MMIASASYLLSLLVAYPLSDIGVEQLSMHVSIWLRATWRPLRWAACSG